MSTSRFLEEKKNKDKRNHERFGSEACFNVIQTTCDPGNWKRQKLNDFSNKSKQKKLNEIWLEFNVLYYSVVTRNSYGLMKTCDETPKTDYVPKKIGWLSNVRCFIKRIIEWNTIQNGIRSDDGWMEIKKFQRNFIDQHKMFHGISGILTYNIPVFSIYFISYMDKKIKEIHSWMRGFGCDENWLIWNKQCDSTWIHTEISLYKHVWCVCAGICFVFLWIPLRTLKDDTFGMVRTLRFANDNTVYYNKWKRYSVWNMEVPLHRKQKILVASRSLSFDTIHLIPLSLQIHCATCFALSLCNVTLIVFIFHLTLLFIIFFFLPLSFSIVSKFQRLTYANQKDSIRK